MGRPAFTRPVERPQDTASRAQVNEQSGIDVTGLGSVASSTGNLLLDSVSGEVRVYELLGWLSAATAGVDTSAVHFSFNVRDSGQNTDEGSGGVFSNLPYSPESAFTVPENGDIEVDFYNYNSNSVDLSFGARYEVV